MESIIKDGTGAGNSARVDINKRLHTYTVSQSLQENQATDGKTFNVNTGFITLTSAAEAPILYIKNNDTVSLRITQIGLNIGSSTGGSGNIRSKIIRNPTVGTIVSGASNVDININKNFGSNETLNVIAFKGTTGATLTDGIDGYYSLLGGANSSYVISTGDLLLPRGASLGIKITPPTGNTSMTMCAFLAVVKDIIL